jgi:hypothetical protein
MGGVPAVDELLPSVHVLPYLAVASLAPPNRHLLSSSRSVQVYKVSALQQTDFRLAVGGSGLCSNVR